MRGIATRPSERFLLEGQPEKGESRAEDVLVRRQQYLKHELDVEGGYAGRGHDQREHDALTWVLAVLTEIRLRGGLDARAEEHERAV